MANWRKSSDTLMSKQKFQWFVGYSRWCFHHKLEERLGIRPLQWSSTNWSFLGKRDRGKI